MKTASLALLGAALLAPSTALAQSGFLKNQGAGYVKLSFDSLSSSDLYSTSGQRFDASGTFTQSNLRLYGEVGVLDFLTVGVDGVLLRLNSFDTSEVATGLGDVQLFAKAGLQRWGFHGAFILGVELPTGRSEANVGNDFDGTTNLPTGDGETNLWFRLALSRPFSFGAGWQAFVNVHGGVNYRTQFSTQLAVGGSVGVSPLGWFWVEGGLDAQFTPTPVEDLDPTGIFLFGEGTEFVAGYVGLSIPIPKTPISVTGNYRNTFANLRNLYAGSTFSGGLAVEWN